MANAMVPLCEESFKVMGCIGPMLTPGSLLAGATGTKVAASAYLEPPSILAGVIGYGAVDDRCGLDLLHHLCEPSPDR